MSLPGLGVPVDPHTGQLLSRLAISRLAQLNETVKVLRQVLHDLDGTTLGSRPGDRRMALAFTKIEEAQMWASAAILDHYGD
jgi:hypothetical protein